jgi:hypothetical protein
MVIMYRLSRATSPVTERSRLPHQREGATVNEVPKMNEYDTDELHHHYVSQNQDLQQQQQQPQSHQQSPLFASGGDFGGGAVGAAGAAIDGPEGGATTTVAIDVEDPAISALPRVLLMGARRGGKTSIQVRWRNVCLT